MTELLNFFYVGFLAFVGCHYTLSTFWNNVAGRVAVSAVFAVLCAVFLSGVAN